MTIKTPVKKVSAKQTEKPTVKKKLAFAERIRLFDKLVYAKDFDAAHELLITMLAILERGEEGFGTGLVDMSPLSERQATIFCAAITRMMAGSDFVMNDTKFFALASLKRSMMQAFEVSGYRGTEHFLATIGSQDEKGRSTFNRQEIIKLFLCLSVNVLSENLVKLLLRQAPDIAWPLCLAFLSEQIVYTKTGQAARPKILKASELLSRASAKFPLIRNLGPAYMGCSYDESAHKHEIKDAMNAVVTRWLRSVDVEDAKFPHERRAVKKRPTVLIMAELYDSRHAMHRCYGPSIASLKPHFKTILMTPSGKMDDALDDLFDKVDPIALNATNPKAFFDKAKSYRPDIVYFPSVGMRLLSIVGSNLRMAPIQAMTFGHPATTRSPNIDYAILDAEQIGSADTLTEKILCRASKPRFALRTDADYVKPILRLNPNVVRIAVPAWSRKVSPTFLQHCQKIEQQAKKVGKKVEFWFFPNAVGSLYQGFSRRVQTLVTAKILPRTNYNAYIQLLNKCDIFLSSFPFGATNGIVDAIKQGIPVVNLTGPEVHEANDSHIVKRFEQPDWLTTHSGDEYVAAVMRLVNDNELRVKIGKALLANDPDSKLIAKDGAHDFATVLRAAYKHHEEFQASDQKMWQYETLAKMVDQ